MNARGTTIANGHVEALERVIDLTEQLHRQLVSRGDLRVAKNVKRALSSLRNAKGAMVDQAPGA